MKAAIPSASRRSIQLYDMKYSPIYFPGKWINTAILKGPVIKQVLSLLKKTQTKLVVYIQATFFNSSKLLSAISHCREMTPVQKQHDH